MNDKDLRRVGKTERELFKKLCKKTHADRIRAMTDEELAEMHVGVGCPPGTDLNELCFGENGEELLCTPPRCRECWLNWLRQEAT